MISSEYPNIPPHEVTLINYGAYMAGVAVDASLVTANIIARRSVFMMSYNLWHYPSGLAQVSTVRFGLFMGITSLMAYKVRAWLGTGITVYPHAIPMNPTGLLQRVCINRNNAHAHVPPTSK